MRNSGAQRTKGSGVKAAATVWLLLLFLLARGAAAQVVVDRIVAKIEDDVITLSEMREQAQFERLVEGKAGEPDTLLRRLIEQWVVRAEIEAARFPRPAEADVARALQQLESTAASPAEFWRRAEALGLSREAVRRAVERQIWFLRYVEYKFRPTVVIDAAQLQRFYDQEFAPALQREGRPVPPLAEVESQIQEVLVQKEIQARMERWLEEARQRLRIEPVRSAEQP